MASEILSVQSRLKEAEKDALESTIDLIQIVKGSCDRDDPSQQFVWKLTIVAYGCDEYVFLFTLIAIVTLYNSHHYWY